MKVNTDLHLHSKYSMASSRKMELPTIAREASKKGMELLGTADCTHPKWLEEIKKFSISNEDIRIEGIYFIPTTEIEDNKRVHHLLILPSISKAEELAERISPFGNLEADGRPNVNLNGSRNCRNCKRPWSSNRPLPCIYSLDSTLWLPRQFAELLWRYDRLRFFSRAWPECR